jgi:hypothetical protein
MAPPIDINGPKPAKVIKWEPYQCLFKEQAKRERGQMLSLLSENLVKKKQQKLSGSAAVSLRLHTRRDFAPPFTVLAELCENCARAPKKLFSPSCQKLH